MLKIKLQMFADLDSIIEGNTAAFEGTNIKETFSGITTKLGELGYDVLINNKKQAEFVPSSRLGEVVSQRDKLSTQIAQVNAELETLKKNAGNDTDLQGKLQTQITANEGLLKQLDEVKIQTEIFLFAKDARNAKDLLAFVNYDNVRLDKNGNVVGAESEVSRLRTEKPYLFEETAENNTGKQKKKGGMDKEGGDDNKTLNMNALIRKKAGRL